MKLFIKRLFKVFLIFMIAAIGISLSSTSNRFQLQPGDLLFQDLNCGSICNGIDSVTYGVNNTYISHVGLVVSTKGSEPHIIEAIGQGVIETPLSVFLNRSLDESHHPRVVVGRLNARYKPLIPAAIAAAKRELGKPYNDSFYPNHGESIYCSQLIYRVFKTVNHRRPLFHLKPMNFNRPGTLSILPVWKQYFASRHIKPPQGMLGSNPGMMSREHFIKPVYWYGRLRQHSK